jgi:spore coat polysaccharide biosynthesis protein SpsF (cytidylyltransferase family)
MLNYLVILQARMESTRLPGKVLMPICGKPMIELQISRILRSKLINDLVVAIPDTSENDVLNNYLENLNVKVFRGSHHNVYERYVDTARKYPSKSIIRLTADCPLVMPDLLDQMILYFNSVESDYLSNALTETFPDGLDIEIFKTQTLLRLQGFKLTQQEKEFVTLGIYKRPEIFLLEKFESEILLGNERWTVDYPEDFEFVTKVFEYFQDHISNFNTQDVLNFVKLDPNNINKKSAEFRNIALKPSVSPHSDIMKQ